MEIACPSCGSKNVRFSRPKSWLERYLRQIDVRTMRCQDCRCRFRKTMWTLADLKFARCPKCYAMDLNRWNVKDFAAPNYMLLLLKVGANPYRCEYCQFNFVSLRERKRRFRPQAPTAGQLSANSGQLSASQSVLTAER